MNKAFFFDMDGILFNSMPNHARAWEEVMTAHGLDFKAEDCYINEGRTGQDVIHEAVLALEGREPTEDEIWDIYEEKTRRFYELGPTYPIENVDKVLRYLRKRECQIWVVTGSGQATLFDHLNEAFPVEGKNPIFARERMITAFDVTKGKPDPEPYLKAWQKSGLKKDQCFVIENAPLGVRSGKGAGLTVLAVNTGPLAPQALYDEKADFVFDNMTELLNWLQTNV